MTPAKIAILPDRGVVSVTGPDAAKLLQGLITNDMGAFDRGAEAIHAGLLSPQGKILFDFLVVKSGTGFLLDVARDHAPSLMKRLTMYKLRADVTMTDVTPEFVVMALWGEEPSSPGETKGTVSFIDPRAATLGLRILAETVFAADVAAATNGFDSSPASYHAYRISLGVPEGGKDYDFGDAYPHEADFDLFNGVSFTKGCYVGQEVVSRMQNKTIVRKRVVKVTGSSPLASGADILLGKVPIGRIGSTDGANALAMLRLDRAVEALDKGTALTASGVALTADAVALDRYRASVAARSATPGLSS
jgi:folate-binding protein YgfZ